MDGIDPQGTGERLAAAARRAGVRDERVLAAITAVDRRGFVPADSTAQAGADHPVPIPHLQTTSQPSLVAVMVEALEPRPDHRVLDVGTGHGYQAAVLSRLVREVWSVERWPDLAEQAARNLAAAGCETVHVVTGDGSVGLPEHAPYDGIVVGARCEQVPPALVEQLSVGGRLVLPVGPVGAEEGVVLTRDEDGAAVVVRSLGQVRFVPLVRGLADL